MIKEIKDIVIIVTLKGTNHYFKYFLEYLHKMLMNIFFIKT